MFGGIVGAAAAIYVSNRMKPIMSAFAGNDAVSSMLNQADKSMKNRKSSDSASMFQGAAFTSSQNQHKSNVSNVSSHSSANNTSTSSNTGASNTSASNSTSKKDFVFDESLFKEDGLNKVEDIVNQDPKLRAAVDEILAGNGTPSKKEQQQTH